MTVASSTNKITYAGNGSTRKWPFTFKVLDPSHLQVIVTDTNGAETTLSAGYSVDLDDNVVTYPIDDLQDPLPSGYKITLLRWLPIVQELDLKNQSNYEAEALEREYDYLTMTVQQLKEITDRSLVLPVSSNDTARPEYLLNAMQTAASNAQKYAEQAKAHEESAAQSAQEAAASAANAANKVDSVILTNATPTAAGYMSAADKTKLDALIVHNTLLPVGTVMWLSGNTVPDGCLAADGAAVSRTTYSELFAAIGTTWGKGDGSTTFNLPDARGRVPEGAQTAGGYNAPGLPNITGAVTMHSATPGNGTNVNGVSGAFYADTTLPSYRDGGNKNTVSGVTSIPQFFLDASRSSSIYGRSSTVQPASVKLLPVIVYRT